MKKLALVALGLWLATGVAWAIDELDATKPASTSTARDLGIYERETRAKVNELIDALAQEVSTWTKKSAAYTARGGEKVIVDTQAGAVTITLPTTPAVGMAVELLDAFSSWDEYACTLDGGDYNVNGSATYVSYLPDDYLIAVFVSTTTGWRVVSLGSTALRGY